MKKIYYSATILLLIILVIGCKKKEPVQEASENLVHTVFTAGEKSQTSNLRTTINDNLNVLWEGADMILVCSQNWRPNARSYHFSLTEGAGTTMGIFEGEAPADISHPVYCIYPCISEPQKQGKPSFATRTSDIDGPLVIYNKLYGIRNYEMGFEDMGRPSSCLHGVGKANETNHFTFKHLTGLLKLSLKSTEEDAVVSISIKDKTECQLFGEYYVDPTASEPSIVFEPEEAADSVITMNMPDGVRVTPDEYTDFIFMVPGNVFSDGMVATIESAVGEVRRIYVDAAPVKKGGMTTMKRTVNLAPPVPATITVSSDNEEYGTVSTTSVIVYETSSESITATPNNGYDFVNWTLSGSALLVPGYNLTDATIKIRSNGTAEPGSAVASFKVGKVYITVGPADSEQGSTDRSRLEVDDTKSLAVTATGKAGYEFDHWVLNGSAVLAEGTVNDATIRVKSDGTTNPGSVLAYFKVRQTTITVSSANTEQGTVDKQSVDVDYFDKTATITATPKDGFTFEKWTLSTQVAIVSGTTTSPTITIKSKGTGNTGTAVASFKSQPTTITVTAGEGGRVNGGASVTFSNITSSSNTQVTATTFDGYEFVDWTFEGSAMLASGSTTSSIIGIKSDGTSKPGTVKANFKAADVIIHVMVDDVTHGTVDKELVTVDYFNKTATVTATANPGYIFTEWTYSTQIIKSLSDRLQPTFTFKSNGGATEGALVANFIVQTTVSVTSNNSTQGSVSPAQVQVTTKLPQEITATPNDGYEFDHWELNGSAKLNSGSKLTNRTISIKSDGISTSGSAVAYFKEKQQSETVIIDGEEYEIVTIGDLVWVNENLHATQTSSLKLGEYSKKRSDSPYLPYYYDAGNGYLYNFSGAMSCKDKSAAQAITTEQKNRQGICPSGYRIPTETDWTALKNSTDYSKFKTGNAGYIDMSNGNWSGSTIYANGIKFMTASVIDKLRVKVFNKETGNFESANKMSGYSVRCVKNK